MLLILEFQFELNQNAYVYVLLYDSGGKLYPAPEIDFPLQYKEDSGFLILPDEKRGYMLDKNKGMETVFVLASKKPISNFEEKLKSLEELSTNEVLKKLKNKNTLLETLTFKHHGKNRTRHQSVC